MRYPLASPTAMQSEPPLDPPDAPECPDCGAPVQRWGQRCAECRREDGPTSQPEGKEV